MLVELLGFGFVLACLPCCYTLLPSAINPLLTQLADKVANLQMKSSKDAGLYETKTAIHVPPQFARKTNYVYDNNIYDLMMELHPTPAVSGFPKNDSIEYILNNEGYNRKYYTGFLGPINSLKHDSINLFVNLRSMKVYRNKYVLYLGGGLNYGSIAEKEWQETENKAKTLEEIIKK